MSRGSALALMATLLLGMGCGAGPEDGEYESEDELESDLGSESELQEKVEGGQVASGYPSVVLVGVVRGKNGFAPWCTGTVIGKNWVLTAAHCVRQTRTPAILFDGKVVAGKGYRHPDYHNRADYDVALIELDEAVRVRPSRYAGSPPPVGAEITIVGFGGRRWQPAATYTKARIDTVEAAHLGFENPTSGGYTYEGDSGGPDFYDSLIVGIDSTGASKPGSRIEDALVSAAASWIEETSGISPGN